MHSWAVTSNERMHTRFGMSWSRDLLPISSRCYIDACTVLTGGLIANDQCDFLVRVNGSAQGTFGMRKEAMQRVPWYGHVDVM